MEAYKITEDIRKIAAALHEDLRNYGGVSDIEKTLVVSACMLAIKYEEDGIWCIDELTGDQRITDGEKYIISLRRRSKSPYPKIQQKLCLMYYPVSRNSR